MAQIRIERVLALPDVLIASTMYIVKSSTEGMAEIHFSNADGSAALRTLGRAEVEAMIAEAGGSTASNIIVAQDIAARNALVLEKTSLVLVLDATADVTVEVGSALYVWDTATSTYSKVSEYESLDLTLSWNALEGRPESTPTQIDAAVDASHTHDNKSVLDKFAEDEDGLTYNGQAMPIQLSKSEW